MVTPCLSLRVGEWDNSLQAAKNARVRGRSWFLPGFGWGVHCRWGVGYALASLGGLNDRAEIGRLGFVVMLEGGGVDDYFGGSLVVNVPMSSWY